MAKLDKFQELIFQLGDLARDRLAHKPQRPRAMDRVFKAEHAVLSKREEIQALEQQMNDAEQGFEAFLQESAIERQTQLVTAQRFKRAIDAVESKVKGLRKQLSSTRAQVRYTRETISAAQARVGAMEQDGYPPEKVEPFRQHLKRQKVALLRQEREAEDLEQRLSAALSPEPGAPGAAGIIAHRRLLELEEETERRRLELDTLAQELDARVAQKEVEIRAAEDFVDQALYLLGEECYEKRFADPELAVFYPRLDKLR